MLKSLLRCFNGGFEFVAVVEMLALVDAAWLVKEGFGVIRGPAAVNGSGSERFSTRSVAWRMRRNFCHRLSFPDLLSSVDSESFSFSSHTSSTLSLTVFPTFSSLSWSSAKSFIISINGLSAFVSVSDCRERLKAPSGYTVSSIPAACTEILGSYIQWMGFFPCIGMLAFLLR